jgi:serine/threonine-protein kinase RsbW
MPTVDLEIPSRTPYVGVARLAVASLGRRAGLDEDSVDDLKIAVSEACTNAVMSNETAQVEAPVMVSWIEEPGHVVIEVGDRGAVYDAEANSAVDSQGFSSRMVMSVALLRSLVDECTFVPRDGGGMITRLALTTP